MALHPSNAFLILLLIGCSPAPADDVKPAPKKPVAEANPNQFSLACNIDYRLTLNGKVDESPAFEPSILTYSFDLDTRQWCFAAACEPADLDEVTASRITFQDRKGTRFSINRTTGDILGVFGDMQMGSRQTGTCTKAPFKPFPKSKF